MRALSQADVELLALIIELHNAVATPEPNLSELRQRHDIFYGRNQMALRNTEFDTETERRDYARSIAAIENYMAEFTPLVDGPDSELRAALPRMLQAAEDLRPMQRVITLSRERAMARDSDRHRGQTSTTLRNIAILSLVMLAILVGMLIVLAYHVRKARWSAALMAQTQQRLEAIISASLDAILVVNSDGVILDCNSAAERLFDYPRGSILGRRIGDLITDPSGEASDTQSLLSSRARFNRIDGWKRDGTRFPAESTVATTSTPEGSVRVCFLHDITYRLNAELALIQARDHALAGEKAKADMLAVMSHEMRTPLNGILGTLELLQNTPLTPSQHSYLQIIASSGGQLLSHVNDVLNVARLDAGKMPVLPQGFDLKGMLSNVRDSQAAAAEARGNRIKLIAQDEGLDWVLGDVQKLRQVVLNLVSNAIKFTKDGEITIWARRTSELLVQIRVSDTGIGIPTQDLERVFEEFVTLDASYGRLSEGTGLGLPISRKLVQVMGGKLTLASLPDVGSLFEITLPLPPATRHDGEHAAAPQEPPLARSLQVLVVEDNPINRFVVRTMLEEDGHITQEAVDGHDGVKQANATRFDLILMDIAMPELDGVAATQAIRGSDNPNRTTPIFALTAHALPTDHARFMAAGITYAMTKPLNRNALRRALQQVACQEDGTGTAISPSPAPEVLLDHDQIQALSQSLGPDVSRELRGRFIAETQSQLGALSQATSTAAEMARIAHMLAGTAAVFGAVALHKALIELEAAASEPTRAAEVAKRLAQANTVWAATLAELEALPRA